MIRFLMEAGPLIWPIILLTPVIGLLVLWNVIALLVWPKRSTRRRRHSIDAILFWGGVAALVGFLGQWIGFHKMIRAVAEQGIVNPAAVAYGISESLLTPIAGMFVLVTAGLLWFLLRLGLWSVARER